MLTVLLFLNPVFLQETKLNFKTIETYTFKDGSQGHIATFKFDSKLFKQGVPKQLEGKATGGRIVQLDVTDQDANNYAFLGERGVFSLEGLLPDKSYTVKVWIKGLRRLPSVSLYGRKE